MTTPIVLSNDNINNLFTYGYYSTAGVVQLYGAAGSLGFSVFNPASSTKTIYIYSIKIWTGASVPHLVYKTTADPNYAGLTCLSACLGSGTSVANVTALKTSAATPTGAILLGFYTNLSLTEYLNDNEWITCLPGSGVTILNTTQGTAGNVENITLRGLEM